MGMFDFIQQVLSAPTDIIGGGIKQLGNWTGLDELSQGGDFISGAGKNPLVQGAELATIGALTGQPEVAMGAGLEDSTTAFMPELLEGAGMAGGAAGAMGPSFFDAMDTLYGGASDTAEASTGLGGTENMAQPGMFDSGIFGDMSNWWDQQDKWKKMMMMGGLSGLGSGILRGKQNTDIANSLDKYFANTQWTPERRDATMKGVMGQINSMISGSRKAAGRAGADLGRGGGFFGNEAERARAKGRETAAGILSSTYAPTNQSPEAYIAAGKAQQGPWETALYDTLQGAGSIMGKYPYYALLDKYMNS